MWTRSDVIGIAKASCDFCHGYGLRPTLHGADFPCGCVFRAIFRICYGRYRECHAMAARVMPITWDRNHGTSGYRYFSRKREEYAADFCLVSRRVLSGRDYDLFRLHFLAGHDWRICCPALRMERGAFFHHVYLITERLGRAFGELRPYPLYPVDQYFGTESAVWMPPPEAPVPPRRVA